MKEIVGKILIFSFLRNSPRLHAQLEVCKAGWYVGTVMYGKRIVRNASGIGHISYSHICNRSQVISHMADATCCHTITDFSQAPKRKAVDQYRSTKKSQKTS